MSKRSRLRRFILTHRSSSMPKLIVSVASMLLVGLNSGALAADVSVESRSDAKDSDGPNIRLNVVDGDKSDEEEVFVPLADELKRSMTKLELPGHKPPYFIEYTMYESDDFSVEGTLGAVVSRSRKRGRSLFPIIRVGSYSLDNSNFKSSVLESTLFSATDSFAPIDSNYHALRRSLWLLTDKAYKNAVEAFEEKKAYLLENNVTDKLDDFSRHEPLQWLRPTSRMSLDQDAWQNRVKRISAEFLKHPHLYDSWARFDERILNSWYLNSEGSRVRTSETASRLLLSASIRADDGMPYDDYRPFLALDRKNLPSDEDVKKELNSMADMLEEVVKAPVIDFYEGPVLFEAQAASEFFGQMLSGHIKAKRQKVSDPVSDAASVNPFAKKLGRRVAAPFLSVIDDPLSTSYEGKALFGGFEVDEEGVKAQKVTLIENGVLVNLLAGRTPATGAESSNGHGVSTERSTVAKNSILHVSSNKTTSQKKLYSMLRHEGKELGLECVYIVRRMCNKARDTHGQREIFVTPGVVSLSRPLYLYRVSVDTGAEELVRGAEFSPVTLRALKDIIAVGDARYAYPVEDTSNNYFHVLAPSVIVREIEIERSSVDEVKPPVLPSPLSALKRDEE